MNRHWGKRADQVLIGAFLIAAAAYIWQAFLPGPSSPSFAGTWEGTVGSGPERVLVLLHLDKQSAAPLVAVVSAGGKLVQTFEADRVTTKGNAVAFALPELKAAFEGQVLADGTLTGRLHNPDTTLTLVLTRSPHIGTNPKRTTATTPSDEGGRRQDGVLSVRS